MSDETPRPPATPEFGAVTPDGPGLDYSSGDCERVTKLSVGRFDNNVYVVRCTGTRDAVIVDGSAGPERLAPELEGYSARAVLITHNHPDHLVNLARLVEALSIPVYAHPDDAPGIALPTMPVADGDEITVGNLTLRALHTPGHTRGSVCYLLGQRLFSGDALFPGGPGATGGDAARFAQAMGSLDTKIFPLPDGTRVSPGHGLDTTIGRERPHVETWRKRGW